MKNIERSTMAPVEKQKKQLYGKYGTLAKIYLAEHNPGKEWGLGENLTDYLHGVDRAADEMFETLYARLSASEEYRKTGDFLSDLRKETAMRKAIEVEILNELVYVN